MLKSINISLTEDEVTELKNVANLLLDMQDEALKAKENNMGFYIEGIEEETLTKILAAYTDAIIAIQTKE